MRIIYHKIVDETTSRYLCSEKRKNPVILPIGSKILLDMSDVNYVPEEFRGTIESYEYCIDASEERIGSRMKIDGTHIFVMLREI